MRMIMLRAALMSAALVVAGSAHAQVKKPTAGKVTTNPRPIVGDCPDGFVFDSTRGCIRAPR